jgi:hypothetical protein
MRYNLGYKCSKNTILGLTSSATLQSFYHKEMLWVADDNEMHSATAEAPVSYIRQRWKAAQDRYSRVFMTQLILIWPHVTSRISDEILSWTVSSHWSDTKNPSRDYCFLVCDTVHCRTPRFRRNMVPLSSNIYLQYYMVSAHITTVWVLKNIITKTWMPNPFSLRN